jgi:uncharacterized membrane protein YraQ (UPF0718 family)
MTYKNLKKSFVKSLMMLWNTLPLLIGVILLISLLIVLIPKSNYSYLLNNNWYDIFISSSLGSILAGNPVTSYIIAGEFLKQGISLLIVTAFIVSWVTVGIVQFPAESILLGKKFALIRNILAFFFSIIVAIITIIGVNLL